MNEPQRATREVPVVDARGGRVMVDFAALAAALGEAGPKLQTITRHPTHQVPGMPNRKQRRASVARSRKASKAGRRNR